MLLPRPLRGCCCSRGPCRWRGGAEGVGASGERGAPFESGRGQTAVEEVSKRCGTIAHGPGGESDTHRGSDDLDGHPHIDLVACGLGTRRGQLGLLFASALVELSVEELDALGTP